MNCLATISFQLSLFGLYQRNLLAGGVKGVKEVDKNSLGSFRTKVKFRLLTRDISKLRVNIKLNRQPLSNLLPETGHVMPRSLIRAVKYSGLLSQRLFKRWVTSSISFALRIVLPFAQHETAPRQRHHQNAFWPYLHPFEFYPQFWRCILQLGHQLGISFWNPYCQLMDH